MIPKDVYMAYPIDQAAEPVWLELVEEAERYLLDEGWSIFDPGDAFKVTAPTPWVPLVNETARGSALATFAFLPMGVPSIGVPIEIERSARDGKLVVIASDNHRSFSLEEYRRYENVSMVPLSEEGLREAVAWLSRQYQEGASRDTGAAAGAPAGTEPLPVVLGLGARLPHRGYADDAGLDLYVVGDHHIQPGEFVDVVCNVRVALPEWSWGLITGRSSTLRRAKILVHSGIIDPGWRGPLFAGAMNVGEHEVVVHDGERIAQLIILPNLTREFTPVSVTELPEHERGEKGFGSTGQ